MCFNLFNGFTVQYKVKQKVLGHVSLVRQRRSFCFTSDLVEKSNILVSKNKILVVKNKRDNILDVTSRLGT